MMRDIMLLIVLIVLLVAGAVLSCIIYWIFHNSFHYPYFVWTFDVSRKRKVEITDYIDRFLCDDKNWQMLKRHEQEIAHWKTDTEAYLQTCMLRKRRMKQYHEILNDEGAFCFETVRNQTRYKQRNYVKTAYQVSVSDSVAVVSWEWLLNRHMQLEKIDFEATLKEYHSKNQRKLMTRALREKIMERDGYTCQICGKYMPDEVGLHIDHIVPVTKGGKTVPSNLQVLCSKCNGHKGAQACIQTK